MPTKTEKSIERINKLGWQWAEKNTKPLCYVEDDVGSGVIPCDYCFECAAKVAAKCNVQDRPKSEWVVRHGSSSDHHDAFPMCHECGCYLEGWVTDYGAEQELAGLEEAGMDRRKGYDCYCWLLCENAFLTDSDEYRRLLNVAGL